MPWKEDPENGKAVKELSKNTVEVKALSLNPNSKSGVPDSGEDDKETNRRRPRK